MNMRVVAVVQRRLTAYRVPLFERMRELLAAEGVVLRLIHGEPDDREKSKADSGCVAWAEPLPTRYLADGRICWQPFGRLTRDCDLVVAAQENRLVYNLVALTLRRPRRLAFWGHGRNFQSRAPDGMRERFKRMTGRHVDWWFAYTDGAAAAIAGRGFPRQRVTALGNTIDTETLRRELAAVSGAEVAARRAALGLTAGCTGVFLGSLYAEKRLDFLVAAGTRLAQALPGFRLIVAGDGPDRALVESAARAHDWLHFAGPVRGAERALLLHCADFCMNPGAVGLGVVDMFVAGRPTFTTDCGLHGPEIDYLEHERNGLVTADTLDAYVAGVLAAAADPGRLRRLSDAAAQAGERYTIENMAQNFTAGILACLATPPRRAVRAAGAG